MSRPPKKPILALDTEIVADNAPCLVQPKLFIGSIHSAFNMEALEENGITHVLNCSRLPSTFPKNFTYLNIEIRDKDDSNILSCIPIANIFIEAGLNDGGVLIHCIGGRSRSAAFVAGYLMSTFGYGYDQALSVIVSARPVASINRGFEIQLRAYSKNNYNVYMAQQILVRSRIRALHNLRGSKSTIDSILASIEASQKSSKSNHRKISDGDRVILTNSISKPIVRSSFSPIPLELRSSEDSAPGSGQKRVWVDTYEEMQSCHKYRSQNPECDNELTLNLEAVNHRGIRSDMSELKTCSQNLGRQSPNVFNVLSESKSRKNSFGSPVTSSSPSYPKILTYEQTVQSVTLPKIVVKSPSITNMDPIKSKQSSRKNSGDMGHIVPLLSSRSKSLTNPCTDSFHSTLDKLGEIETPIKTSDRKFSVPLPSASKNTLDRIDFPSSATPKDNMFKPIFNDSSTSAILTSEMPLSANSRELTLETNSHDLVILSSSNRRIGARISCDLVNEANANSRIDGESPQKSTRGKGSNKHEGGYQSIIREYIPLFDSKTPHIRFSRPGISSVRVIPPLRGLDRSFCCSWCGINLFTFANVVRSDIDVEFLSKSGAFDILPGREETRRLVHIPTSTTNKTGLFVRKMSQDLTAAMIHNHMMHLQQQGLVPPTPHSMKKNLNTTCEEGIIAHRILNRELSENILSLNDSNVDEERDEFHPISTGNMPAKYVLPLLTKTALPSSRARGMKAFNFDSSESSKPSTGTTIESEETNTSRKSTKLLPTSTRNLNLNSIANDSSVMVHLPKIPDVPMTQESNVTPMSDQSTTSSRSQSPFTMPSTARYDESPRVSIPPQTITPIERISAEKQRWLERVNLLHDSSNKKISAMADADEEAQKLALVHDKYIFLEYLEWMGAECFQSNHDVGEISCHNCKKVLGSWTWAPTDRQSLGGKLQGPLFRIHKHSVHQSEIHLDATPLTTPRGDDPDK